MTPRRSASRFQTLAALAWRLALAVGMLAGTAPAQAATGPREQTPAEMPTETPLDAETADHETDAADAPAAPDAPPAETPAEHADVRAAGTSTDGTPPTPPPER